MAVHAFLQGTVTGLTVHPTLLVGLDQFGVHALARVRTTLDSAHPELLPIVGGVTVSGEGIFPLADPPLAELPQVDTPDDVEAWLNKHRNDALQLLQCLSFDLRGLDASVAVTQAGYRLAPVLDVYVLASAEEAFGRVILPVCLDLLEEAVIDVRSRGSQVTFTLCVGVDSVHLSSKTPDQRQELKAFLDWLADGLRPDGERWKQRGHPLADWCYLLDIRQEAGPTLKRIFPAAGGPSEPMLLTAEVIAGYLVFLIGSSLRASEEYASRGLATVASRHQRKDTIEPFSSFSCASWVLPVRHVRTVGLSQFGALILGDGIVGERGAGVGRGRQLAAEWSRQFGLDQGELVTWLRQDDDGRLIDFRHDPRWLEGATDDDLVKRIIVWEAYFNRHTMSPHLRRIQRKRDERGAEAVAWIHQTVDRLITREPEGVQTARPLLEQVQSQVGLQRAIGNQQPEVHRPDTTPRRRALEWALLGRMLPAALIVRHALLGFALSGLVVGIWPHLEAQFGRTLRLPFSTAGGPLDLASHLVLVAITMILVGVAGFGHRMWSEQRIASARDALIDTIERRLEAESELAGRNQRDQIYNAIDQEAASLLGHVDAWRDRVQAQVDELARAAEEPPPPLLCLDRPVLPGLDPASVTASPQSNIAQLAERLLEELRACSGERWADWSSDQIVDAACSVAEAELKPKLDGFRFAGSALQVDPPAHLLDQIAAHTRPLANINPQPGERTMHFAGAADRSMLLDAATLQLPKAVAISTGDPGRITYAVAQFGFGLEDLALTTMLDAGTRPAPSVTETPNGAPSPRRRPRRTHPTAGANRPPPDTEPPPPSGT